MFQLILVFIRNLPSQTIYGEVIKAKQDPVHAKPLVKRFSDQRRMALMILGSILAFYVNRARMTAAANALILILLSSHISSVYDGINEATFKAFVDAIGPAAFTFVNILPSIISQVVLCIELVTSYNSKPAAVAILLLVILPGFLQIIAGSVFRNTEPSPVEP